MTQHIVRVPNLYFVFCIQYSWGTWLHNTMIHLNDDDGDTRFLILLNSYQFDTGVPWLGSREQFCPRSRGRALACTSSSIPYSCHPCRSRVLCQVIIVFEPATALMFGSNVFQIQARKGRKDWPIWWEGSWLVWSRRPCWPRGHSPEEIAGESTFDIDFGSNVQCPSLKDRYQCKSANVYDRGIL